MIDHTVRSHPLYTGPDPTEVLSVALALQERAEAQAEAAHERRALLAAAEDLGVTAHLPEAEQLVAEARRARAVMDTRRRRFARWATTLAITLCVALVAVAHALAPSTPWSDRLDDRARWTLTSNPESSAALEWTRDGANEVATVFVDRFRKDELDRTWRADLDGVGLPPLDGHESLTVELQGTLPRVRLELRRGPDERWLSPPIDVSSPWTVHRLALRSFDHQRFTRGRWRSVRDSDREDPSMIDRLVLTLGDPVNPVRASGVVRIRSIGAD